MCKFVSICAIPPGWVARFAQGVGPAEDCPVIALAIQSDGRVMSIIMMPDGPEIAEVLDDFVGVFPAPSPPAIEPGESDRQGGMYRTG